jgi:hypothetical protein
LQPVKTRHPVDARHIDDHPTPCGVILEVSTTNQVAAINVVEESSGVNGHRQRLVRCELVEPAPATGAQVEPHQSRRTKRQPVADAEAVLLTHVHGRQPVIGRGDRPVHAIQCLGNVPTWPALDVVRPRTVWNIRLSVNVIVVEVVAVHPGGQRQGRLDAHVVISASIITNEVLRRV